MESTVTALASDSTAKRSVLPRISQRYVLDRNTGRFFFVPMLLHASIMERWIEDYDVPYQVLLSELWDCGWLLDMIS